MNIEILNANSAFNPGSEIWFVSEPSQSAWANKMDWYINFQLNKSADYKFQETSPKIKEILQDQELELKIDYSEYQNKSLLIYPSENIPAKYLVCISAKLDEKSWLEECKKVWLNLGSPNARIFATNKISLQMAKQIFHKLSPESQITWVNEINN